MTPVADMFADMFADMSLPVILIASAANRWRYECEHTVNSPIAKWMSITQEKGRIKFWEFAGNVNRYGDVWIGMDR